MLPTAPKAMLFSAALAGLALSVPAGAATPGAHPPAAAQGPVQSELQARYTQLENAMESRSPARIKALLAPGFTSTQLSGKTIDADAMIGELARVPRDPNRKTNTTLVNVAVTGDIAHVEQTMTASALVKGHAMKLIAVSDDTWVHTGQGWLMKTTTSKDMTVTQDGKVVRHTHIGDPAIAAKPHGTMGPVMTGR